MFNQINLYKNIKFLLKLRKIYNQLKGGQMEWLKGVKVYILCGGAILTAVGAYAGGEIDVTQLISAIWAALTGIAMRAGIAKGASPK